MCPHINALTLAAKKMAHKTLRCILGQHTFISGAMILTSDNTVIIAFGCKPAEIKFS